MGESVRPLSEKQQKLLDRILATPEQRLELTALSASEIGCAGILRNHGMTIWKDYKTKKKYVGIKETKEVT